MTEPAPPFDAAGSLATVRYEYEMALATAVTIAGRPTQGVETIAALESFLVHARNLHEFLRPHDERERRPGDVWASDYVDGFGLDAFDPDEIREVNRRLQHVTTWRQGRNRTWDCLHMLHRLHAAMEAFVARLDAPHRALLEETHRRVEVVLGEDG